MGREETVESCVCMHEGAERRRSVHEGLKESYRAWHRVGVAGERTYRLQQPLVLSRAVHWTAAKVDAERICLHLHVRAEVNCYASGRWAYLCQSF